MQISSRSNSSPQNPWRRRALLGLCAAGAAAGIFWLGRPKPLAVETALARRKSFTVGVREDGIARVRDRYVVSAPLGGNLARLELHPGDDVERGALIAHIVPARAPLLDTRAKSETEARVAASVAAVAQARSQIERAKIARDFARAEAEKLAQLSKAGAVSRQELDRGVVEERSREADLTSAEFAASVANHELAMAQATLGRIGSSEKDDQFAITSPVRGRVLKIFQESEGVVVPGAKLVEIGDPSALEVAVDVLTSDAVQIKPHATVTLEDWGGKPLLGSVRLVEPSAFTRLSALGVEEQRVNAIVDVASPYDEWRSLGDGYHVSARIEVHRNEAALVVPWSTIFRSDGRAFVFVVENGRARLRGVTLGRQSESDAEILDGLHERELVVLHPSPKIADNVAVEATISRE